MPETIRYYAHLEQKGDGCDHTIGCGHALRRLKATTLEEARVEALLFDGGSDTESHYSFEARIGELKGFKRVRILAVVEEHDLGADIAAKVAKLRGEQAEEVKRRQLEELAGAERDLGAA